MAYTTPYAEGLGGVTDSITRVVADPCLSQAVAIAMRVTELRRQRQAPQPPRVPSKPSKAPSTPPRPTRPPAPIEPGIGLCRIVGYANKALYVYERPWVIPATLAAIAGGLVLVGYAIGRRMS